MFKHCAFRYPKPLLKPEQEIYDLGFREITLELSTDYTDGALKDAIAKQLGIRDFSWQIQGKSLDARKKNHIHWLIRASVLSDELRGGETFAYPSLDIPWKQKNSRALVVGSGPAGFFAALVLQKAGFKTQLIERGSQVARRSESIQKFESSGTFDPMNNYAFGEGGAGTFSDGKLTSRTKKVAREK